VTGLPQGKKEICPHIGGKKEAAHFILVREEKGRRRTQHHPGKKRVVCKKEKNQYLSTLEKGKKEKGGRAIR